MPIADACERGFSNQGAGHVGEEVPHVVVPDDRRELGHADAEALRFGPHRQFVAEEAGPALVEAGQAHVIAQEGDEFHVEIVERDDAAERPGAGQVRHRIDDLPAILKVRQGENFVDRFTRPRLTETVFRGQQ